MVYKLKINEPKIPFKIFLKLKEMELYKVEIEIAKKMLKRQIIKNNKF